MSPNELLLKKFSIWIKIHFLMIFENIQNRRHVGLPFTPVFPWFGISCDVDIETRYLSLDSSRLFCLCKLSLVVLTKCRKGAFYMDYKAKFTEVKQA